MTKPLPWEGLDHLAYALVAIKMLAGVDRLVTVPLGELLRRGVSEEEVLRAGDKLVARAVVRLSAVGIRFLAVLSHWSLSATLRCAYCQRQTPLGFPRSA